MNGGLPLTVVEEARTAPDFTSLAVNEDRHRLYVAERYNVGYNWGVLRLLDSATLTPAGIVDLGNLNEAVGILVDAPLSRVYVDVYHLTGPVDITVIDEDSLQPIVTWPNKGGMLAIDSSTHRLFTGSQQVLDGVTGAVVGMLPTLDVNDTLAVAQSGGHLYHGMELSSKVEVLDLSDFHLVREIPLRSLVRGIDVDEVSGRVYVAIAPSPSDAYSGLYVLDDATGSVLGFAAIADAPTYVKADHLHGHVWVAAQPWLLVRLSLSGQVDGTCNQVGSIEALAIDRALGRVFYSSFYNEALVYAVDGQ
jgi:DNA-binding beta-propeller fold protein YncE